MWYAFVAIAEVFAGELAGKDSWRWGGHHGVDEASENAEHGEEFMEVHCGSVYTSKGYKGCYR